MSYSFNRAHGCHIVTGAFGITLMLSSGAPMALWQRVSRVVFRDNIESEWKRLLFWISFIMVSFRSSNYMRHLQRIWTCVFSECIVSYDIWICICFDLCPCPHILTRTGIRKFFFILMLRIIYHWGHGSACWRPSRRWLYLGLSFGRSPVCPVAGGLSVWRLLGPVFWVLWLLIFFSFVCLFVFSSSLVHQRLFNILSSW